MRKEERLTRNSDYVAVYNQGKVWTNNLIAMKARPNELGFNRYGVVVGKRISKKAVKRNRVKRLLREAIRLSPIKQGWDLVIIARSEAAAADYQELEIAIRRLLSRAGLLKKDEA
jgi:ribonuclease P protein component